MTLMKSLLLGSAAALVTVAAAQAADLPTKKGAPAAEYVKICKINGMAGFVIPGSDTCLKISGAVVAMAGFGNVADSQAVTGVWTAAKLRNNFSLSARGDVQLEAVSNTAYGPLIGVVDVHSDYGAGFQIGGGGATYANLAYLQWAGLTAGQHGSFYDFIAGGEIWTNLISPNHTSTGIPLFAYTATFGGGFSATISAENPVAAGGINPDDTMWAYGANTMLGTRAPDFVGALDLTQGWGTAHAAVVAHNVRVEDVGGSDIDDWGWGAIVGVGFNMPQLGAGDVFKVQGSYTHEAIGYSGLNYAGWGIAGGINMNGNGILYPVTDAVGNGAAWSVPTTWGVAATAEFHLTPQFEIAPEFSYIDITWSNRGAAGLFDLPGDTNMWNVGALFSYTPVTNLSFNLELMYEDLHWAKSTAVYYPAGSADGWNGRVRVERDF